MPNLAMSCAACDSRCQVEMLMALSDSPCARFPRIHSCNAYLVFVDVQKVPLL